MKRLWLALAFCAAFPAHGLAQGASPAPFGLSSTCPPSGPSFGVTTVHNELNTLTKTGAYTVQTADCGAWLKFTISTATTVTLPSVTGLTAGFYLSAIQNDRTTNPYLTDVVSNPGGAFLTITPQNSVFINGATSLILPPGSSVSLKFNGNTTASQTSWDVTSGVGDDILMFTQTCSGTGCWTPNSSLLWADVACLGAGGGGGAGASETASGTIIFGGGGGGAGAAKLARYTAAELNTFKSAGRITYTISTGGAGGAGTLASSGIALGGNGTAGGSANFAANRLTCFGGGGGGGAGSTGAAGGGGAGMVANGGTPTQNVNTGGTAGNYWGGAGGSTSVASATGIGCGGSGGSADAATGVSAGGARGYCAVGGASGGGITAAGAANAGGGGNTPDGGAVGVLTSASGGTTGGGAGGDGPNPTPALTGDGLLFLNQFGITGGGNGGGGGGNIAGDGGKGGNSGYGSGGSGGGACFLAAGCTGGAGGTGGGGVIMVWEHNN